MYRLYVRWPIADILIELLKDNELANSYVHCHDLSQGNWLFVFARHEDRDACHKLALEWVAKNKELYDASKAH